MIRDPILVMAFLLAIVAFARWLEDRFDLIKKISSAVVCTLLGIALANLGVIAHGGPPLDGVYEFAIAYAIVLVVLGTNLRELTQAGRPLLMAYGIACAGSLVGGVVAGATMAGWVGPETWKLSGAFSAAFAGGGLNFGAVGQALEIEPGTFAAAALADNLSTVPYLVLQVWLAGALAAIFLRRTRAGGAAATAGRPATPTSAASGTPLTADGDRQVAEEAMRRRWTDSKTSITDMAILGAMPLAALWLAQLLSGRFPVIPEVLWLTTMALIAAQLPWIRRLRGAEVLSYFALHMFFIVLGAKSELSQVVNAGAPIFTFMIVIIATHMVVAYGLGWLLRIDLPTVSIASQAAIGGPGSALAIGMALKWYRLVPPAVIVGIFGYALGTYLGTACARLVSMMLA